MVCLCQGTVKYACVCVCIHVLCVCVKESETKMRQKEENRWRKMNSVYVSLRDCVSKIREVGKRKQER